jgi:hypothetical protein
MPNPSQIDNAGRQIAGLLTYNPGPGIYSRLERAVEAMPENVRVQELPGLLKRYKDGVPGWELKATDLDSTIAGRDVVPREELLGAVRERSPVYTHSEAVLGGRPPTAPVSTNPAFSDQIEPVYENPSYLGAGRPHGEPRWADHGQGGEDYTELLLLQPGQNGLGFGSHWSGTGTPVDQAVAHARFDTHGDALRINEIQSDLGIHNRKIREVMNGPRVTASYPDGRVYATDDRGIERLVDPPLPFPMEDAWADVLIKRMALEAAHKGHRAIEVASPRAIADKVAGNIDNYEHFYGKVVPGALERLGRKMGGLIDDTPTPLTPTGGYAAVLDEMTSGSPTEGQLALRDAIEALRKIRDASPSGPRPAFADAPNVAWNKLAAAYQGQGKVDEMAHMLHGALSVDLGRGGADGAMASAQMMPELMRLAENHAASMERYRRVNALAGAQRSAPQQAARSAAPGRRYIMSDEMRRRLIQQGVGAAVAGGVLSQDDLIDRLNQ